MKPILVAKEMCKKHGVSFIRKLDQYLTYGFVYSGDDCFIMASLESSEDLARQNLNKNLDADTWFIYIYAGNLRRVLELIPFNKRYIAFRRDNKADKIYDMKRLVTKLENANALRN